MFVVKANHEFDWPVKVRVPVDGGQYASHEFTARFRLPGDDELKSIERMVQDDSAAVRKVVVGWSGIVDENKEPVPFAPETLDALARVPWIRVAIWQAFVDACFGIKRKN